MTVSMATRRYSGQRSTLVNGKSSIRSSRCLLARDLGRGQPCQRESGADGCSCVLIWSRQTNTDRWFFPPEEFQVCNDARMPGRSAACDAINLDWLLNFVWLVWFVERVRRVQVYKPGSARSSSPRYIRVPTFHSRHSSTNKLLHTFSVAAKYFFSLNPVMIYFR